MGERFKADCEELKRWCGSRRKSLEAARQPHEPVWRDLRRNFEPDFGKALLGDSNNPDREAANRDDEELLNSEPRTLLRRMGAGMQGGITNPARQWFLLGVHDAQIGQHASAREWLDTMTKRMGNKIQRSNFYTVSHQKYQHLGYCGNSASLVVRGPGDGIHLHLLDEGAYWIADDHHGRVDTLLRKITMTAAQIRAEFGELWTPEKVAARIEAGRAEDRFDVWNLICPNDGSARFADIRKSKPFASVYWIEGCDSDPNAGVLAVRPFGYNPILAPRWDLNSGVYGTGPGHVGLGDAKELQRLESDSLKVVANEADPPMQAPESMKGRPVATFPGGVTYYPEMAGGREGGTVSRLFETRQNIKDLEYKIDQVRRRLERIFFTDLFAMLLNMQQRPKVMTAREVNELAAEKMALLGPVLTRMNQDFLDPFIDAVFAIMLENGEVPEPPDVLKGQDLKVEYVSVLHTEQQSSSRMGSMIKLADFVQIVAPMNPECVDKIDVDQAIDEAADALAVPAGIIRDDKDVAGIRGARAQQQAAALQAQQQAATMPMAARAVKDLGATKFRDGTALDAVAEAMGPGEGGGE